jgi:hypothetical protein
MDIHKPKPWFGWREFLKEIGTIVVGVLIALGAEQAVEAVHWRHKVAEAERAMRFQLSADDGAQAFARAAVTRCLDDQLGAIIAAVEAGRDRSEVARLTEAYRPPHRSWDRQAWEAAVASDVASHMGAARLNLWGGAFGLTYTLNAETAKETDAIDLLTSGSDAKGALSADQADRVLGAAKSLRRANAQMDAYSLLMLRWLPGLDASPAKANQAAILADARAHYGSCAASPDMTRARPETRQFSPQDGPPQAK